MTARIELGDWHDILPGSYDPAHAVVVTDPPFGLRTLMGARAPGSHAGRQDIDKGFIDELPWAEHLRAILAELPAVRHVVRGPATAIVARDYPPPRRLCVELSMYRRRGAHRPGVVPYLWCGWVVYGRLRTAWHPRPSRGDGVTVRPYTDDGLSSPAGTAEHRGMTPYGAAEWAVETWADPGYVVLDPFAGTGTIGRAALSLGFDYLGAEISPLWHAEAERSIRNSAPTLGLDA